MDNFLFDDEQKVLKRAEEIINSGENSDKYNLMKEFELLKERYEKKLQESEKLLRIGDKQYEGLKKIQNMLKVTNEKLEKEILERKKIEAQLNENLELLKITQEKLIISEKSVALGRFANGVAHEINNPLGAVLTSIQMIKLLSEDIKEETVKNEIIESSEIIEEAAKNAGKIISKLLKHTERETRNLEKVDLKESVEISIIGNKKDLEMEGIKIVSNLIEGIIIKGNSSEIINVIDNIISNSKYALLSKKSADKLIAITMFRKDNRVILEIEDNGIGMSKEVQRKAFDPFFTSKAIGEGMGLGLTTSYENLKKYNAEISIESQENFGTKIILDFESA